MGEQDAYQDGRYQVHGQIGKGGMGRVLRAFDTRLDRPVALKVMLPGRGKGYAERVASEAKVMAQLRHSGIVDIFDAFIEDDELVLVLEYVLGKNLREFMDSIAFTEESWTRMFRDLAAALAFLHSRGIVHRDIKPANILIDNEDYAAKLADFGLARRLTDPRLTSDGFVVGTPEYLAPEVRRGFDATPASDIWSLGKAMAEGVAALRRYSATAVPEPVLATIRSMLQEEPALRPTTAEILSALGPGDAAGSGSGAGPVTQEEPWQGEGSGYESFPEPGPTVAAHGDVEPTVFFEEPPTKAAIPEPEPLPQSAGPVATGKRDLWIMAALALVVSAVLVIPFWATGKPAWELNTGEDLLAAPPSITSAPAGIQTANTTPPPSATPTEPAATPDGPWTREDLAQRLKQPYYAVAGRLAPGSDPFRINVATYYPLFNDARFAMYSQAELSGVPRQIFRHFRISGNQGNTAFTPYIPACGEAAAASPGAPAAPGIYLVTKLTDVGSTFKGVELSGGSLGAYAAIRPAECSSTSKEGEPVAPRTSGLKGMELFVKFEMPLRPDGSWDKAADTPLGMILVSKEGNVVLLPS